MAYSNNTNEEDRRTSYLAREHSKRYPQPYFKYMNKKNPLSAFTLPGIMTVVVIALFFLLNNSDASGMAGLLIVAYFFYLFLPIDNHIIYPCILKIYKTANEKTYQKGSL